MYTKDGVFLKVIADREDWVWCVRAKPKAKHLAVGCNVSLKAIWKSNLRAAKLQKSVRLS